MPSTILDHPRVIEHDAARCYLLVALGSIKKISATLNDHLRCLPLRGGLGVHILGQCIRSRTRCHVRRREDADEAHLQGYGRFEGSDEVLERWSRGGRS